MRGAFPTVSPRPQAEAGVRDSRVYLTVKRSVDILLAAAGLLLSLPLTVMVATAIKIEDGGPIFFRQKRPGLDGKLFTSYKFRSMIPDADDTRQAGTDDDRITRVGRVLRATAMDELPQLINILRGEMSFVGPRALPPAEKKVTSGGKVVKLDEIPGYEERHSVRPGLTGIAQVYGARDMDTRHKFHYDIIYVRKRGLLLDLRLIVLSLWFSVTGAWPEVGRS